MRSYLQMFLRGVFLVGFVASFAVWQRQENQWKYLVFTQQWPAASCIDINETHGNVCYFPSSVKSWTIHGLWPNRNDGRGPFYCNSSYPFNEQAIMDLEPEMLVKWPNLISNSEKTSFWKHEWEKHGTCATSLSSLATEHEYFKQSLLFNKKYNLLEYLSKHNIKPSDSDLYKLNDIRESIEAFTESKIKLQCIKSEDDNEQAIIQVEICVNKSFQTIDCDVSFDVPRYTTSWDKIPYNPTFEDCDESLPIRYIPLPTSK